MDINKDYNIISPAIFDWWTQEWRYEHINEKTRISGDAMKCGVRYGVMKRIEEEVNIMFPHKDDEYSNKKIYTANQVNQMIRFAVVQNCKKLVDSKL